MHQNSLDAYNSIEREKGRCRLQVLDIIKKHHAVTREDISKHWRRPINCVTPRVNELLKVGSRSLGNFDPRYIGLKKGRT